MATPESTFENGNTRADTTRSWPLPDSSTTALTKFLGASIISILGLGCAGDPGLSIEDEDITIYRTDTGGFGSDTDANPNDTTDEPENDTTGESESLYVPIETSPPEIEAATPTFDPGRVDQGALTISPHLEVFTDYVGLNEVDGSLSSDEPQLLGDWTSCAVGGDLQVDAVSWDIDYRGNNLPVRVIIGEDLNRDLDLTRHLSVSSASSYVVADGTCIPMQIYTFLPLEEDNMTSYVFPKITSISVHSTDTPAEIEVVLFDGDDNEAINSPGALTVFVPNYNTDLSCENWESTVDSEADAFSISNIVLGTDPNTSAHIESLELGFDLNTEVSEPTPISIRASVYLSIWNRFGVIESQSIELRGLEITDGMSYVVPLPPEMQNISNGSTLRVDVTGLEVPEGLTSIGTTIEEFQTDGNVYIDNEAAAYSHDCNSLTVTEHSEDRDPRLVVVTLGDRDFQPTEIFLDQHDTREYGSTDDPDTPQYEDGNIIFQLFELEGVSHFDTVRIGDLDLKLNFSFFNGTITFTWDDCLDDHNSEQSVWEYTINDDTPSPLYVTLPLDWEQEDGCFGGLSVSTEGVNRFEAPVYDPAQMTIRYIGIDASLNGAELPAYIAAPTYRTLWPLNGDNVDENDDYIPTGFTSPFYYFVDQELEVTAYYTGRGQAISVSENNENPAAEEVVLVDFTMENVYGPLFITGLTTYEAHGKLSNMANPAIFTINSTTLVAQEGSDSVRIPYVAPEGIFVRPHEHVSVRLFIPHPDETNISADPYEVLINGITAYGINDEGEIYLVPIEFNGGMVSVANPIRGERTMFTP